MTFSDLPAVNASLNTLTTGFLLAGYGFIRQGRRTAHRNCMIAAIVSSTLFLTCYLTYHAYAGRTVFVNPAWFRPLSLTLLLTHTVLAAVIVPMVLVTASRGLRERFDRHKAIARWTWPLWMYVSVTGVMIYLLLYWIFPQKGW
jgi:putative membrane protein